MLKAISVVVAVCVSGGGGMIGEASFHLSRQL